MLDELESTRVYTYPGRDMKISIQNKMDLTPYGINCVLTKDTHLEDLGVEALIRKGSSNAFLGTPTFFILEDVRYTVKKALGEGSYGVTYHVVDEEDRPFALKVLLDAIKTPKDAQLLIKECVIQILMADASKDEAKGPYVPRVYEVAYNATTKQGFLRSELMRGNLDSLLVDRVPKDISKILPDAIVQITKMLEFFGKTLQFSHRDLKGDNIMYIKNERGHRVFKLIDFGMSCLTWNGLTIRGGDYFSDTSTCFKPSRDIMQFLYSLTLNPDALEPAFLSEIQDILVATIAAHDCKMGDTCAKNGLTNWRSSYNFLNRDNLSFPKGAPKNVRHTMRALRTKLKTKKHKKT